MAEVARLEGRLAIDGIRSAQSDLRAFDSSMRDAERSANKAADGIEKSGSRMGSALSGLAKGAAVASVALGAGLAAGIAGSIKVAADFQQSLANVGSATGATADQMKAMRQEALKIGADTSKSASEAVSAMGELVKAGMSVETVIGGAARATVQLAEATGIDMVEAATLTSNAMNTFKAEGLDAATAASIFAKAANASAIDVSDLGQSLSAVGAVWSTSGQNMQDFATAVGILGNNAIRGSDAGTSLKAMLAGLTPNSKEAAAAMRDLGINAFNADGSFKSFRDIVANLQQAFGPLNEQQRATYGELIFGSDAVRSLNVLLKEGVTGWDAFGESMAQAPSLAEQSATRMGTLNGQIEMLKGSLETIAIEVGSLLLPALTQIVGFLAQNVGPAFDVLRTKMAGLWANIGPEATAAGQAIVTGLTVAATWITDTFLPAAGKVAADIWSEAGPKAEAAATAITTGLQRAITWIDENWPAIQGKIVSALEGAEKDVGPAIDRIVSKVKDLKQAIDDIDTSDIESAIDRMQQKVDETDFTSFKNSISEVREESRRWSDLIASDWGPAMANLGSSLSAGKEQIDQMLPSFVNLENAAKAAGGILATVFGGAITMALAPIALLRTALEGVKDILETGWPGAFRAAMGVFEAMLTLIPGGRGLLDGLREVIQQVGSAASGAAGFLGSLAGGISAAAGAASAALGPLRGALDLIGKIGSALPGLGDIMKHSPVPLAEGVKESSAAIARLNVELARLNQELKFAEPMSEHAAAIQHDIDILEAWRGQLQASNALLKAEADALEASKTALDGATEARSSFLRQQSDVSRFGSGGADVMGGLLTALTEGTAESGREAYAGLEKFIDGLPAVLGSRAQEAGNHLRFLFFEALSSTGEDREAALGRFGQFFTDLQAQQQAQMTVSGQTMNSALTNALFDEAMVARLGEKGAAIRQAIAHALDVSGTPEGEQAMANTAKLLAGFETELRKLPASIQGPILAEYRAAMQAFADAPDDAGVAERLAEVVRQADAALSFIPKNLDKLAPEMRAAALKLFDQVKAGLVSAEDAQERFSQAMSLIPQDMAKLAPQVRAEIQKIIDDFAAMGGSAEGAADAIEMAMQRAADAAAAAADAIKAADTRSATFGGMQKQSHGAVATNESQAQLYARVAGQGGHGQSQQEVAAFAAGQEQIGRFYAEERERLNAEEMRREHLRQLSLQVGQSGRTNEANAILTELSMGLITIDEAIRELLQLLRRGQTTNINIDGRQLAAVTTPYFSEQMSANVRGMGGG